MANRSRLGRDPLQAAPKPSAQKPAAPRRKPAAAKGDASAEAQRTKTPAVANNDGRPAPVAPAAASPDEAPVVVAAEQSQPSADAVTPTSPTAQAQEAAPPAQDAADAPDRAPEPALQPDQAPALSSAPSPDLPPADQDWPTAAPLQAQEAPAAAQDALSPPSDPVAAEESDSAAGPDPADPTPAVCPDPADPTLAVCPDPSGPTLAAGQDPADPTPAVCPDPAGPALAADAHPVAVFLRGVLEGLLPDGEAALCVDVDESTSALPVEKLFFFSHALQRIAMPLENAASAGWRPGMAAGPLPVLTVRLRPIGRGRHSLTLFDNGCFFQSRLPGLSLGMEALTPLTAFVAKRQGSVVLAQGRVTAFEIIG